MTVVKTASGSAFAVPVTKEERKRAEQMRDRFANMLINLAAIEKFLNVFFDHSNDLQEGSDLSTIAPLITKYENKLRERFNKVLYEIGDCLDNYGAGFVDNKLDNIKELIIQTATDMRRSVVELLGEFGKVEDPQFLKRANDKFAALQLNIKHMNNIIREELYRHIDQNILGRIRIGSEEFPLVIRG